MGIISLLNVKSYSIQDAVGPGKGRHRLLQE